MKKMRVLYVSQEITPFLPKNELSEVSRKLPQGIHEKGKEIRVFMPRYGTINERRHQLHEVIRLSGMNLVVDDTDHPLIIKVASIPAARMQVYFIDNEDYFQRKAVLRDKNAKYFKDNDERAIFFARGVLETVRKLGWAPDVIHCHGWFTSLLPLYVKKLYNDDPHFENSKVVFSAYQSEFKGSLNPKLVDKLKFDGFKQEDIDDVKEDPSFANLHKLAFKFSDGLVHGSPELDPQVHEAMELHGKNVLPYCDPSTCVKTYSEFYESILQDSSVLVD